MVKQTITRMKINLIENDLIEWCKHHREQVKRGKHKMIGEYVGLEDFVLKNGHNLKLADTFPVGGGELGDCYKNAYFLALDDPDKFYYCEGYALFNGSTVPHSHAWVVNRSYEVLDPTWEEGGIEYYGIIFSDILFVTKRINIKGQYVCLIDNYQDGWPLLKMLRKELLKNIIVPKQSGGSTFRGHLGKRKR